MRKVRVITTLKNGIKDNQGNAVGHVLQTTFNYDVDNVRIGKIIDLEVDDSVTDAQIKEMAKAVSNPIMDNVRIEILKN